MSRPIGLKDNIAVAGLPTGNGLGREGQVAAEDSAVVARLREKRYTFLPRQAMDEAAFGATGDNPYHGRIENPRAPGCSPGGSSCGGAAAVATGMAAAIGTDTLGSVRIPAAYCGIVGFKPTRDMMPMQGVVPLSPSMDDLGIMVRDMAVLAEVAGVFLPVRRRTSPQIVWVPEDLASSTEPVRAAFEESLAIMVSMGWVVVRRSWPGWSLEPHRRAALLLIEAEGALSHRELVDGEDPALSPNVRAALRYGRDAGARRIVEAVQTLRRMGQVLGGILDRADIIATPTTPSPAYGWAEGPPRDQALFTGLANWSGLPAISIPLATTGRPIGLHLMGRHGRDWTVIDAATSFMEAAAAHSRG